MISLSNIFISTRHGYRLKTTISRLMTFVIRQTIARTIYWWRLFQKRVVRT